MEAQFQWVDNGIRREKIKTMLTTGPPFEFLRVFSPLSEGSKKMEMQEGERKTNKGGFYFV